MAHRRKVLAKIYRKTEDYPFYRMSYMVDGKRMMKFFASLDWIIFSKGAG